MNKNIGFLILMLCCASAIKGAGVVCRAIRPLNSREILELLVIEKRLEKMIMREIT